MDGIGTISARINVKGLPIRLIKKVETSFYGPSIFISLNPLTLD